MAQAQDPWCKDHRSPPCQSWTPWAHVERRLDRQTQVLSTPAAAVPLVARFARRLALVTPSTASEAWCASLPWRVPPKRRSSLLWLCGVQRTEAPGEARAEHGGWGSPARASGATHRRGSLRWSPGALRLRAHRRRLFAALAWCGWFLHRGQGPRGVGALGECSVERPRLRRGRSSRMATSALSDACVA